MDLQVVIIRKATPKAIQVVLDGGKIMWIPKKAIKEDYLPGEKNILVPIAYWFGSIIAEQEWREMMKAEAVNHG